MGKNAKLEVTLWLSALGVLTLCLGGAIYHRLTAADGESTGAQARIDLPRDAHGAGGKNDLAPPTVDRPTVVKVSPETTPDYLASTAGGGFRAKAPRHPQDNLEFRSAQNSASIMPAHDLAQADPLAADAADLPAARQSVVVQRDTTDAVDVLAPENQQSPTIATAPASAAETTPPDISTLPLGPQSSNMGSGTRVMMKATPDDQEPQEPAPLPVVDARPIRRDSAVQQAADNVQGMDPPPAGSVPWQRPEMDTRIPVVSGPASLPPPPPRNDATSLPPVDGAYPPAYPDQSRFGQPQSRLAAEPQYAPANEVRPRYQPPATLPGVLPPAAVAAGVSSAESGTATAARKDDKYVVQPNDNWWTITQRVYGNGAFYKALHEYNHREYPRPDLAVGDTIRTPDLAVLQKNYPDLTPKARKPAAVAGTHMTNVSAKLRPGTRSYTVQQGDTMFDIARFQLGKASRWTEIYELNRDTLSEDFDFVRPGTILLLPADEARGDRPDTTARTPSGQIQR